ncbi:hypothetical protein Tco_0881422 [Tanacetum coccineum]
MTEKDTNEESVPKHSYDPSQSGEDRMQLHELMNLCTKLSDRVLALETTKTTQALEIASLKSRVKKLKKKASKRSHKFKRLYRVGTTRRVESSNDEVDETQGMSDDTEMFDTDALIGDEVFAENDMTEKEHDVIPREVIAAKILTTAGITILVGTAKIVSTAEIKTSVAPSTIVVSPPVITEVEITLAQTLAELKSAKSKDKGKAKMIEPKVPLNKKDQIRLDEELTIRLDVEEQEAARLERENVELQEQATLAKIEECDNVQAMMDADYELCKRLQEQDQVVKKSKKAFDKTMGWINNFKLMDSKEVKSSEKKAEGSKKKSTRKKRAGNDQKQESFKRQRIKDDKETDEHEIVEKDEEAKMKKHMEIVQDKKEIAIDAIPVATKPPMIVEYKIVKEGQKGFYHLIRADGSSKRYSSMIKMLQNIDREDLETLWKLVKAKHGNTRLEDDYERVFWGDLKVMFEPDIKSEVWRSLQGYKVTV